MSTKVVIVDYKLGNLFSIEHALAIIGLNSEISSNPHQILSADALVLPGVGSFKEAMNSLKQLDLINPLKDYIDTGKPLLGICLGFQLLFSESEEFGHHQGLDVIQGTIKKFESTDKLKVPHIGWNKLTISNEESWKKSPFVELKDSSMVYFVHSYYASVSNKEYILSNTTYDTLTFPSSIIKDNIFATQFHPEKSQTNGLVLLNNFIHLN
jgi:glutamine amidotransferase